jgi:phosphohistidine phosphatase SixA
MSRSSNPPAAAPPRYKLALLTWAGAYAAITALLALLGPITSAWPLPLRTLPLSALMVVILTWVVIPSLTRVFRVWLSSSSPASEHPLTARRRRKAFIAGLLPLILLVAVGCVRGDDAAETGGSGAQEETSTAAPSPEEGTTETPAAEATPEGRLVSELRDGGYVIFFRHTPTDWSQDDQHPVDLTDCSTQRNLNADGREQAVAIGVAIERLDIPVGRVLSSPFCRATDTAELAFGRVAVEPVLENLESAVSDEELEFRNDGLRQLLSTPPIGATNTVLVSHGYNVEAVADVLTEEGDAYVFREQGDGYVLVATVTPAEWGELADRYGGQV